MSASLWAQKTRVSFEGNSAGIVVKLRHLTATKLKNKTNCTTYEQEVPADWHVESGKWPLLGELDLNLFALNYNANS